MTAAPFSIIRCARPEFGAHMAKSFSACEAIARRVNDRTAAERNACYFAEQLHAAMGYRPDHREV
jgi:hypothetical protein